MTRRPRERAQSGAVRFGVALAGVCCALLGVAPASGIAGGKPRCTILGTTGNGGNSGITIEIGGGNVVTAVLESASTAPAACNFQTSAQATIANKHLTKSLIAVEIANSGSEVFQAQLQYVNSDTVSLSEATAASNAGICLFRQNMTLNALG